MQSFLSRTLFALSSLFFAFSPACKKEAATNSKTKYLHIDDPNGILYTKIFKPTLKVCLSNQTDESQTVVPDVAKDDMNLLAKPAGSAVDNLRPAISAAVLAWVSHLKDIVGTTEVIRQVEIVTNGCTNNIASNAALADISVFIVSGSSNYFGVYHPADRAHTPYIHLFPNADAATVLHEFGHAFGLADTYDETKCMFGQPEAIMCNRTGKTVSLLEDDIAGVRNKFCTIHKDRFAACAKILTESQPGMQPTTKIGNQNPLAGIEVKDFKMTTYSYDYKKPETSVSGQKFNVTIGTYNSTSPDNLQKAKDLQPTYLVERSDEVFAGAMIVNIEPGSPGYTSLRKNQFITQIDEIKIASAADFRNALEHVQTKTVKVQIAEYNGKFRDMTTDQVFIYVPTVELNAKN